MNFIDIIIYFAAAALGGAINSVAGGGTFITFPVLMLNGLSPLSANITSTVALWPGSMASAFAYRKELQVERQQLKAFLIISIAGSVIGTALLLLLPEITFTRMVPWLLLFATLLFTFGDRLSNHSHQNRNPEKTWIPAYAGMTAIAIYGGYFGAGMGILMLAMLQLLGFFDIHRMNALKTVLGSVINAVAVLVFILAGKVMWPIAVIMILGGIAGGYLGARTALKINPLYVRRGVSIIGMAMTAYFFLHSA